ITVAGSAGALARPVAGRGARGGGRLAATAGAGAAGDLPLRAARRAAVAGRHLVQRRDQSPGSSGYFPFAAWPLTILLSCTSGAVQPSPTMRPTSLPFT